MDASVWSQWLLRSGEGTRKENRVSGAATGACAGGERAPTEATGRSATGQQAKCRAVCQGGTQGRAQAARPQARFGLRTAGRSEERRVGKEGRYRGSPHP